MIVEPMKKSNSGKYPSLLLAAKIMCKIPSMSGLIKNYVQDLQGDLPHEWLEGAHTIIKHLRPVTSVTMLRIAFRGFFCQGLQMLILFLTRGRHQVVHYEGQGGPVQVNSKPRPEVLAIIGGACKRLRPDVQHLLAHLKLDVNSSVDAANNPKLI
ncbi:hypothetical protein MLD38_017548 [Melastoma candidum]|uniref:Uncharacterized protein n=1 Tax=Melastoma candidum TaxID=119954 RepID=A0ACB9QQE8_9MYRT|nr:hypothetical protein MLD38_017548 [Melastoma candidum]